MICEDQFGVFKDDGHGPMWRASFAVLAEAKSQAQKFADAERQELFVFNFADSSKIARSFSLVWLLTSVSSPIPQPILLTRPMKPSPISAPGGSKARQSLCPDHGQTGFR